MKADAWMPLYVNDYLGATMRLTTEQHGAYLLLIMEGWKSGGTIPDDDEELAAITKMGLKDWLRIAPKIRRFFTRTENGQLIQARLSKEVEKAKKISEARRESGSKGGRPRKQTDNQGESKPKPNGFENGGFSKANGKQNETPQDVARPSPSSVPNGTGAEAPSDDDLSQLRSLPVAKGCWRLAVMVLVERGGMEDGKARTFIGRIKGLGLTDDDLWEIAEDAWRSGTLDPKPYLTAAAEAKAQRRSGQLGILNPPERQQRAWCEDYRDKPFQWKTHERGPPPGEPGCRVSAAIQREFGFTPAEAAA